MRRRFRAWRQDLRETAEWLREDPKVEELTPGGGPFAVMKLFDTPIGPVVVDASLVGPRVTRFDDQGWARKQVWTTRPGVDAMAAAISAADVPADDSARIAGVIEPLIAKRRPEPRPASWHRRRSLKSAAIYAVPWGIGTAWLAANAMRLLRRRRRTAF